MKGRQPIITGLRVEADGDNFEKMLRKFKKKVENDGRLDTLDSKREYIKPSITVSVICHAIIVLFYRILV